MNLFDHRAARHEEDWRPKRSVIASIRRNTSNGLHQRVDLSVGDALTRCLLDQAVLFISKTITLIDFPQMVSTSHLNAKEYFDRDVQCVRTYFLKKFHFETEEIPQFFSDTTRQVDLDVQLKASGVSKDNNADQKDDSEEEEDSDEEEDSEEEDRSDEHHEVQELDEPSQHTDSKADEDTSLRDPLAIAKHPSNERFLVSDVRVTSSSSPGANTAEEDLVVFEDDDDIKAHADNDDDNDEDDQDFSESNQDFREAVAPSLSETTGPSSSTTSAMKLSSSDVQTHQHHHQQQQTTQQLLAKMPDFDPRAVRNRVKQAKSKRIVKARMRNMTKRQSRAKNKAMSSID